MVAKNQIRRLLVLSLALQFIVACQPKSRDRKTKTNPEQQQTATDGQSLKDQEQSAGPLGEVPKSNQSISQVIGPALEKTDQNKQSDSEKNNTQDQDDKDKDKKTKATDDPEKPKESDEKGVKSKTDPAQDNELENLFSKIAIDAKKCETTGVQIIQFQDNEKTALVIAKIIPTSTEHATEEGQVKETKKQQLSVIKMNDQHQIQSVVVSDFSQSTLNSLVLLDAKLSIEASRPQEFRLAIKSQQNELVGQVTQLTKDDQISKQICNKIQLNPISILFHSQVLTFNKETKNKKIELSGSLMSQDQIITEVRIQLLKELKAIVQIANWTQNFDYSLAETGSTLVHITGFGNIVYSGSNLELKLSRGLNISNKAVPSLGRPGFIDSKTKDHSQLVFQENGSSALVFKYSE